ncbi:MAG TPA: gluconeogenesis factor YvcK family protein [Syntrophomonadaceae bacterium]|nr:gluconeogenesis factor YvcK family protein [Syntrophomonadaceae bacterium]
MGIVIDEPRIVVIGGGTGLSVLLKGLKKYTSQLTAVVTVSDDGGSSGRLRAELGVLPPGDIRNCLVALAETETLMDRVFQHRFDQGNGLQGHNLGNLLLVAMTDIAGDFISAIREVSKVLKVRGKVMPATLEHVALGAQMADGTTVVGETSIRNYGQSIQRLFLVPEKCLPVPETLDAIMEADAVVIGPGSLYTSIIPNLLVEGVSEAILATRARKLYVSNIMTESGETDNYEVIDHLNVIRNYLGAGAIDHIILNSAPIDTLRLKKYQEENACPVMLNHRLELAAMGVDIMETDLICNNGLAWHDSDKLARAIIALLE